MAIAHAGAGKQRVDLLLVGVLLNTLLREVHNGNHVLHLHIQASEDAVLVVHLKDVTAQGSVEVKVIPLVVVQTQQLGIQSTVVEDHLLQLAGSLTGRGGSDIVLKCHVVNVGTYGSLQLKMAGHVPYSLAGEAVDVLIGLVGALVQVPIGVLVVLVKTVPVGIAAILVLVVPQPLIVIGAGERHQVLTDVALRVTQCGTVLHVLARVIGGEV